MSKDFYSVSDVAKALGVSVSTIYRWVRQGILPPFDRLNDKLPAGYNRDTYAYILRLESSECLV